MSLRNLCIAPRLIPISSEILRMEKPFSFRSITFLLMDCVRTDFLPSLVPFATVRARPDEDESDEASGPRNQDGADFRATASEGATARSESQLVFSAGLCGASIF